MKKLCSQLLTVTLYFFLILATSPVNAQDGNSSVWVRTWGDVGGEFVHALGLDSEGNSYVAGLYLGSFLVDEEILENASPESSVSNSSLTKYDPNGNLLWSRRIGTGGFSIISGIGFDENDNVYLAGMFQHEGEYVMEGPVEFDFADSNFIPETDSTGGSFLCKIDPACNLIWFESWSLENAGSAGCFTIGEDQNVYLIGTSGVNVVEDEDNPECEGSCPVFQSASTSIRAFDQEGNLIWDRTIWDDSSVVPESIITDNQGNLYITGFFTQTVDFNPGTPDSEHTSNGDRDVFLCKYSIDGDFQWVRTWGGEETDYGLHLGLDSTGMVYVLGSFKAIVDLDPGTGEFNVSNYGVTSLSLSKFSPSGHFISGAAWDIFALQGFNGLFIDQMDWVYITGSFYDRTDFDPGEGTEIHDTEGHSAFVLKLNPDLELECVRTWGKGFSIDASLVQINKEGNILIAGTFSDLPEIYPLHDFDPGLGVEEHASNGKADIYLCNFSPEGALNSPLSLYGDAPIWNSEIPLEIYGERVGDRMVGITEVNVGPGYAVVDYATATDPQGDAVIYNIYYIDAATGDDPFDDSNNTEARNVGEHQNAIRGLEPGQTYHFGVRATDNYGNSDTNTDILTVEIPIEFPTGEGWARSWGGEQRDQGTGVAVDGSGNIYVSGLFSETVDFDPGPGVWKISCPSGASFYLSKFDMDCNLLWVRTWEKPEFAIDAQCILDVDAEGNAFISGVLAGQIDLDPGDGVTELQPSGEYTGFISRFDPDGNFLWAKAFENDGGCNPDSLVLDNSGNIHLLGSFYGSTDFNPDPGGTWIESPERQAYFVVKLDSDGEFKWANTWEIPEGGAYFTHISVDYDSNCYVGGSFITYVDLNPGPKYDLYSLDEPLTTRDIFVVKLNSDGDYEWGTAFNETNNLAMYDMICDSESNVFVTGWFLDTVDLDPGQTVSEFTSNGWSDAFLCKLNSDGEYLWAQCFGGEKFEDGSGLGVDYDGNIYLAGKFARTVDFDPSPGVSEKTAASDYDAFLSVFSPDGDFLQVSNWDGGEIYGFVTDEFGTTYITGRFSSILDLGLNEILQYHVSNGSHDAYLLKIPRDGSW